MSPLVWWVGTTGTTARTCEGERVTVTGINRLGGRTVGAFARSDEASPRMYYAEFSSCDEKGWHGVVDICYEINRDAFDKITGISDLRREWGWAA